MSFEDTNFSVPGSLPGMDLEAGEMKMLKKQLKQTFLQIGEAKETFDTTTDNLQKHRIATKTEKMIASAQEALKKYQFQM